MLLAEDFRAIARRSLENKWGVAVGTGFVASFLGACVTLMQSGGSGSSSSDEDVEKLTDQLMANPETAEMAASILMGMAVVMLVFAIILIAFGIMQFVIGGPVTLGYAKFNLDLVDGKAVAFKDLFSQFHRFGDGFVLQFLRGLFVGLWTLLLVVPGILANYSYSMAAYIMLENPGMSANECIKASKELMKGNRWRFFCLQFSFIGWILLSVFTCGIGFLFLNPYIEAANAAFYREICAERNAGVFVAQEEAPAAEENPYM